jgi:hypothetical protein
MKKIILVLLALLLLTGCNDGVEYVKEKKFNYSSFERVINLKSRKYILENIIYPNKIALKDGILIISDLSGAHLIHLVNVDSMTYITSKGKPGSGPGEIDGRNVREFDLGLNPDTFWAYDMNSKRNYEFTLFDTLSLAQKTIRQEGDFFFGFSMHWKSENEIISYLSNSSYKFGIFDSAGVLLENVRPWSFEKEINSTMGYLLSDVYQGPIDYHPDLNRIVHASIKHDTFEIIDLEKSKSNICLINGPVGEPFRYEILGEGNNMGAYIEPETKLGYNDVFLGAESIFLVYIGKTLDELNRTGEVSTSIFEFDLEGNPKSHFILDRPIKSIVVDKTKNIIYATTEDEDPGIVVFEY